jgi:hypothetical protein
MGVILPASYNDVIREFENNQPIRYRDRETGIEEWITCECVYNSDEQEEDEFSAWSAYQEDYGEVVRSIHFALRDRTGFTIGRVELTDRGAKRTELALKSANALPSEYISHWNRIVEVCDQLIEHMRQPAPATTTGRPLTFPAITLYTTIDDFDRWLLTFKRSHFTSLTLTTAVHESGRQYTVAHREEPVLMLKASPTDDESIAVQLTPLHAPKWFAEIRGQENVYDAYLRFWTILCVRIGQAFEFDKQDEDGASTSTESGHLDATAGSLVDHQSRLEPPAIAEERVLPDTQEATSSVMAEPHIGDPLEYAIRWWYENNIRGYRVTWEMAASKVGCSAEYLRGELKSAFDADNPSYKEQLERARAQRQRKRS